MKQIRKYEDCHRESNGILEKKCSVCNEWLPCNKEYFYRNKCSKQDGLFPYCKKCSSKKSYKWIKDNPDKFKESFKKYRTTDGWKNYRKKYSATEDAKYLMKKWRQEHPDSIKQYNENWAANKTHSMTKEELQELYDYCNSSCMYCGMSEEDAKAKYKCKLFKDHFDNNGSNGIDNCILCCKGCSSSKRTHDFFEWYAPNNPRYNAERFEKVMGWINKFKSN